MIYQLIEGQGYEPRGSALTLLTCHNQEAIISGPSETGKTTAALMRLHILAWKYPGLQGAIARKVRRSIYASTLQTYRRILGPESPVAVYGGQEPSWFDYPNGSRLIVAGLDDPGKLLSSEFDIIYVSQAEELAQGDWEVLLTRVTGRAGHMPYGQLLGDCNPGAPGHWIKQRANEGKLALLESRHEDNPVLYDDAGGLTEQGARTLAVLDSLSGVRLARLRFGRWVSAEGQIYTDYDSAVHLIDPIPLPGDWRRIRAVDFGLEHPFACLWLAQAPQSDDLYVYRQLYKTGRTVAEHAGTILAHSSGQWFEATVCDHDAEDRLTLARAGIPNIAARKPVLAGIGRVQDRLKARKLFIFRNSLIEADQVLVAKHLPFALEQEFESWVWANNATREVPIKINDHGLDALRYAVMYFDGGGDGAAGAPALPAQSRAARLPGREPLAQPVWRKTPPQRIGR